MTDGFSVVARRTVRLMVSVRNVKEAHAALAGGADLIDIKEPKHGALGVPPPEVVRDILNEISGRVPISIALGELVDLALECYADLLTHPALKYVKIGLGHSAGHGWKTHLKDIWSEIRPHATPVAVAYADWQSAHAPHPSKVLSFARGIHCTAVLFDTFIKTGRSLIECSAPDELSTWIRAAQSFAKPVVLAGSLQFPDLATACRLAPDVIAVRSAVCEGSRAASINKTLVKQLVGELSNISTRNAGLVEVNAKS